MQTRAERHNKLAAQHSGKVDAYIKSVPFGQPILLGHYSQRRQENQLKETENHMRKAIEERANTDHLASQADSSRAYQENQKDTGVIARRLERLGKEASKLEKSISTATGETYLNQQKHRLEVVKTEIEAGKRALADAGGLVADSGQLTIGDLVMVDYWGKCEVRKINAKSLKVKPLAGNPTGGIATVSKTWVKQIIQKAATNASAGENKK